MAVEYADCVNTSMKLYEVAFELCEASSLSIIGKRKKRKKEKEKQKGICKTVKSLHSQVTTLKNRYCENLSIFICHPLEIISNHQYEQPPCHK